MMLQATAIPLTTTPRSAETKQTMNCTTHRPNATASTFRNIPPLPQSNTHSADEVAKDSPRMTRPMTMLMTKSRKKTPTTTKTEETAYCTTHQPSANVPPFSNPPSPMQTTDNITDNAKDNFPMMMPTQSGKMTPDATNHDPAISHNNPKTNWISNSFAPIFKALDCLTIEMAILSTNLFAITSNLSLVDPPMPPTPNPQLQGAQPQLLHPGYHQPNPMEICSHNATNLSNRSQPQTHQQNLDPQQTHQSHRNHTKYHFFLNPSLPTFHPHFSKCLPFPVQIHPPTYYCYLANNFQPP